jgi:hypothetical protein
MGEIVLKTEDDKQKLDEGRSLPVLHSRPSNKTPHLTLTPCYAACASPHGPSKDGREERHPLHFANGRTCSEQVHLAENPTQVPIGTVETWKTPLRSFLIERFPARERVNPPETINYLG